MHAGLRVCLLVVGAWAFPGLACAQAEPPSLFASNAHPLTKETVRPHVPASPARSSPRVRSLIQANAARLLAEAPGFEVAPAPTITSVATDGALLMSPVVVKARALQEDDVRRTRPELWRFAPTGGDKHGGITTVSAPLYHAFIGTRELQVDLNILKGAGQGVDHGSEFTRVEIAFRLKF